MDVSWSEHFKEEDGKDARARKMLMATATPEWRESVRVDLRKGCEALATAHAAEAEATMAVFLAEIANDAGVAGSVDVSKHLKAMHTDAVREVNESEVHVRTTLEGDANTLEPVYKLALSEYADKLRERSETLYRCQTKTIAARHLVESRSAKLWACKRHLVSAVEHRVHAGEEVERLWKLYSDGLVDADTLLAQQLEFVRAGAVDTRKAHNNAHTRFMADFDSQCTLFDLNPKKVPVREETGKMVMPAPCAKDWPNSPVHEETTQEVVNEVVHEAVCGLVDRVLQDAAKSE